MPLAPAHPSVVLPLQRLGLPLGALVAGAVAPDTPVYLPVGVSYATTHSGPGIAVDAVLGLVLLAAWSLLVRDAVVDLVRPLRHRAPPRAPLGRRAWLLAPPAVAVGAATHVLWDSCTHDWGFVVEGSGLLRAELGSLPVYRWLQHASTVLGTAVVAAYGVARLRRRPEVPRPPRVTRPGLWVATVPAVVLAVGLALRDPEAGVGAGLVAVLAVALLWRAATSPRARPGRPRTAGRPAAPGR
jgi:hypothetical protein